MSNLKLLIIDYQIGNVQSVYHAFKFLGCECLVSQDPEDMKAADAYVLPGVGAFGEGIQNLKRMNWIEPLTRNVMRDKKPILGICLGMQLFAEGSHEYGYHDGLGWIPGKNNKIDEAPGFRVPHVGWNNLEIKKEHPLFLKTGTDTNFYFDHSYHFQCPNEYVAATCAYSSELIVAVQHENIFGVQFHPEKSQVGGLKLLRCFLNYAAKEETSSC